MQGRNLAVYDRGEFHVIADDTGSVDTTYDDTTVEGEIPYFHRGKARNCQGFSPRSGFSWPMSRLPTMCPSR